MNPGMQPMMQPGMRPMMQPQMGMGILYEHGNDSTTRNEPVHATSKFNQSTLAVFLQNTLQRIKILYCDGVYFAEG